MKLTTRMLYLEEISDCDDPKTTTTDKDRSEEASRAVTATQLTPSQPIGKALEEGRQSPRFPPLASYVNQRPNKVFPLEAQDEDLGDRRESRTDSLPVIFQKKRRTLIDQDELKTIEDTLLYCTMKELFICMKISGIFFINKKRSHHTSCRGFWTNCSSLQVYCAAMCILLLVNFVRSLIAFKTNTGFDTELFFKLMSSLFFYESVSRAMLAFWACLRKKNSIQDLFLSLERVCYPDRIIPYESSIRHTMQVFLILTFFLSFANAGMTAYGMFGPEDVRELYDLYLVPVPADSEGILAFKIFLLLLTFVNGMVAILSLTFYTVVCYILYKEFEYFCRMLQMKIRPDGQFADELEKFRSRHQKRCELLDKSDQIFKYYIANTYLTNIPLLCLLLYSIVYADNGRAVAYRLISTFRMVYVLLQMLVLSVAATIINAQAHAPLEHVFSIRSYSASCEGQLEVGMFLNKLTGTSIGLTAWDMFVINKPTLLTVIGMILTYFLLLVQFQNPQSTSCYCLIDGNVTLTAVYA